MVRKEKDADLLQNELWILGQEQRCHMVYYTGETQKGAVLVVVQLYHCVIHTEMQPLIAL